MNAKKVASWVWLAIAAASFGVGFAVGDSVDPVGESRTDVAFVRAPETLAMVSPRPGVEAVRVACDGAGVHSRQGDEPFHLHVRRPYVTCSSDQAEIEHVYLADETPAVARSAEPDGEAAPALEKPLDSIRWSAGLKLKQVPDTGFFYEREKLCASYRGEKLCCSGRAVQAGRHR